MTDTWIILGASSAMGRAFARKAAEQGCDLVLAARDPDDLARTAKDCELRGSGRVASVTFDIRKPAGFEKILEAASTSDGMINAAVFVGSMPPQSAIDADPALADDTTPAPAPR